MSKSRLYGWLMPAYQDPGNSLLHSTYPTVTAPNGQSRRTTGVGELGRLSLRGPGACPWLTAIPGTG